VSALQDKFAAEFGEENAAKLLAAAIEHNNDVHGDAGADIFRWAICISIGYECWSVPKYAAYHGIDADPVAIKAWIKEHADLASHDGDVDYLGMMCGAYDEYMPEVTA
jgi:hypothetical protein